MLRTLILSLGLISLIGCSPIKTEVEFVNPNPGQTVPLNALIIEVGFDHRMNLETFDSSTFKVEGSTSGAIEGAFTGENENRRVTFTSVTLVVVSAHSEIAAPVLSCARSFAWASRPGTSWRQIGDDDGECGQ